MSTFLLHKFDCSPAALDGFLAQGFRTTGQAVYNCNFLQMDSGEMVSVLPLRLPLAGFSFSKSLRKLLRRNLGAFRVLYGPALKADQEMLRVNQAYLRKFPQKSLEQLEYHLVGTHYQQFFNTWQTKVYDGDQLVAFSFFDIGQTSAYSKAGVYDPAYAAHSLGLFTLALEVEFCQRRGMAYFYPGYASDEDPSFDYKHRLGAMEFYDLCSGDWRPYGRYSTLQRPLEMMIQALVKVQAPLAEQGLASRVLLYPHIDKRYASVFPINMFLDAPCLLLCRQMSFDHYQIVTYSLENAVYVVSQAQGFGLSPTKLLPEKPGKLGYFSDALVVRETELTTVSAITTVRHLLARGAKGV